MSLGWGRLVPSVAVGAFLVFAALGASTHPRAVPDALYYPNCSTTLQSGPSDQVWTTLGPMNFIQPLLTGRNVAACSLYATTHYGQLTAESWDPVALAPDLTTIQQRTAFYSVSGGYATDLRMDFIPPLVTKSVAHVAEPQRATLALDFLAIYTANMLTSVDWSPNGPAAAPGALGTWGNYLEPLPGPHPVLTHWVCAGDALLQRLFVTQSVVRADTELTGIDCYVQRFRVPSRTQVFFVELAFGHVDGAYPNTPGTLAILDAQGQSTPPVAPIGALAMAIMPVGSTQLPSWASHADFSNAVILEPGHDYWLWAQGLGHWRMYTRALTGTESPDFTAGIGMLFRRSVNGAAFDPDFARVLDFKIVGIPQEPAGVALPAVPAPVSLRLRVMPNPAHGAATVAWSGAAGEARIDVIDARGRRMTRGEPRESAAGQWLWRGVDDAGRPLPAGVYFVRVSDPAGHSAVERVVLVR